MKGGAGTGLPGPSTTLAALRDSLRECIPYVNGALHSDQPWRRETAQGVMDRLEAALSLGDQADAVEDAPTFHASEGRRTSPEWDFGVMWIDGSGPYWPLWRVSWIIETGELYAQAGDEVRVLGILPAVGQYPYSGGHDAWMRFKDAQTVEKVMDGWAEGEAHKPLSWITDRLASLLDSPA